MNSSIFSDTMRRPSLDLSEPSRNLQESNEAPSDGAMNLDLDLSMPPMEDDVMEHDGRIYTPPPRIAARFYRPSQARRKDSAASSRRNSISSAQSRCSSLQPSNGDGDQSKYIAQHLRRASFLEDRRARLADRAAHAEKVRLRAALAKATPRGAAASEERALAAQQARERNLAEIVANCAEEVKKAKQVAESMKEKREQEMAKMKMQMEERMAEAERRREEIRSRNTMKRGRGQSIAARKNGDTLPQIKEREPSKMADDVAIARIQDCWRRYRRQKIIHDFNDLGLSMDSIRDTNFDTVAELLAQENVLLISARLLRICGVQEGEPASVEEMAAVRTFLSAFLILGHPTQVLSNKDDDGNEANDSSLRAHRLPSADLENPQLQDLVGKAKDLLVTFENILARLTVSNRYTMPPTLAKKLSEAYAVFHNAFIAWKSRDSNALVEVMLLQFLELDSIMQTVKDTSDDAAAELYRQSIRSSQLMLIVRIKKLVGPEKGRRMIFEAVRDARKARAAKKEKGDTKPRVAHGSASDAPVTASSLVSPESQRLTPPPTPARSARPSISMKGPLNDLLPDNRVVVHELAINKEYRIQEDEYRAQQARLSQPLYEQMRIARDTDSTENSFQFFILMLGTIKNKLQRLLTPGNSMHNLIGEMLDPEIAARQFTLGNFSYEKFFSEVSSLLPRLCAPVRDEELTDLIRNKLYEGDVIDRVAALNGFIDVMVCDYINYMLQLSAPQLIESAAEYEAKRFAEDVESGQLSLTAAEMAWRTARAKVLAEVEKRDPEGINHPKSRPTPSKFHAQMLVDIFTQPTPLDLAQIPEMLRLDYKHIEAVSDSIQKIITAGAVLLQCKNLLKRDVRSSWKTEATRILSVLEAKRPYSTAVNGTMAALEAGRSMPADTKTRLRALVTKVLMASDDMATHGREPTEPVLRLLLTRLRGNILARLAPGSAGEKVKAANIAGEKLASLGLSEFVPTVRSISDLLAKIGDADRAAHSRWWDEVATRVQQTDA